MRDTAGYCEGSDVVELPRPSHGLNPERRVSIDVQDEGYWTAQLVAVGRSRDRGAFEALFRQYGPRVKAFLMRGGMPEGAAEDVMQDVMVTVWRKAHMFDPQRASVATWLFAIARNRRIDLIRRARRPEPEDLPWGPEPNPEQVDALALQEDSRRLADAVAQLPPKQRDLVERAFYGDLTHTEIADATGLPLGTIKSRIRLAITRLRSAMDTDRTRPMSIGGDEGTKR
ncbi:sigma-70 family RNA polymerase sigma factor [Jannaschia aquimarina]|uniref:RpoE_1 protein n=1 Tax=Jannaschia aquimarina TaxID=935700 RepID=A0A0D1EC94_9RHOB|nr:sigma-70 family RNA polymerase sigma factor [Jannaschia aquimarina]KIT15314.1 ECF RNA polymerase sigma factor RpoE [Jannaschia aquimarina]SNS51051.1 RNA polymerase sigma-70 factor, ECF subfamily [Jannaschia aquimarina]